MTDEQLRALHDKLDSLITDVRLLRNEERRHGPAIADLTLRVEALEDARDPFPSTGDHQ